MPTDAPVPLSPVEADAAASAVCLSCGLCCEGALYTHVPLRKDEIAFAEGMELTVVHQDEGRLVGDFYLLPCRHLVDKKCSIYLERFETCRTYQCMLTRNVRAGSITSEDAVRIVQDLRRRFDFVIEHLNPGGAPLSIADLVNREMAALPDQSVAGLPPQQQHAFLELMALGALLKRHIDPRYGSTS